MFIADFFVITDFSIPNTNDLKTNINLLEQIFEILLT